MVSSFDLIVIGSGPAGEEAELAATFGRSVAVVERSAPGGTVTTTGGAPTKTLREAALYLPGSGTARCTRSPLGRHPKSQWSG